MPWWNAKFNWSMLQELQCKGATDELDADIMHLSSGHLQSVESCSMPKLWPISCATVVATTLMILLWSMETPPENSYVQIGPLRALPNKKNHILKFQYFYFVSSSARDIFNGKQCMSLYLNASILTHNTSFKLLFRQQLSIVIRMFLDQNLSSIM